MTLRSPRRLVRPLAFGLFALLALWASATLAFWWRFHSAFDQVRSLMAEGHFAEARPWLAEQGAAVRIDPEIAYDLGVCEYAAGNPAAALRAWGRVPETSTFGTRAALARGQTLVGDFGRFAEAEPLLDAARRGAGDDARTALYALTQLYFYEGRLDEMRRLLEDGWPQSADPVHDLRDHWRIDAAAISIGEVREAIEKAGRLAPDDDRVWLARAHVAVLTGHDAEARKWLDACLRKRPNDPAVWRVDLGWARAFDRPEEGRNAIDHLQADRFTPAEVLEMKAWLAACDGREADQRKALEQLVAIAPGATEALERLAVLSAKASASDEAARCRKLKAEADANGETYMRKLEDGGPITSPSQFVELARLAEGLGRRFEARAWWTLASRASAPQRESAEALARLDRPESSSTTGARRSLAELLQSGGTSNDLAGSPGDQTRKPVPRMLRRSVSSSLRVPRFEDDAERAGLRFTFDNGRSMLRQLPETSSGGVGLIDYDGDGRLDVYLVQGGPFPPDPTQPSGDRLFRNRGDGTFEDRTEASGLASLARGYGHGVTVGDYDNDGHPDLFITRWRSYALYRNRGDGTFEDRTEACGLAGDRDWPTSSAFADLDGDGDLDLYVSHYAFWDAMQPRVCPRQEEGVPPRAEDGSPNDYCNPNPFPASPDHLFRNDGGRFVDVSDQAGITEADRDGRGFGVVAADVDDDGRLDLFVANDTTANYLFHNLGGLRFEEIGLAAGVATGVSGGYQAGMGVACGDLDADGRMDLLVTNFYGESTTFYHNLGDQLFTDRTAAIGLAAPSRYLLGFGIALFDGNNDGFLDVITANGHVNDMRPRFPYAMPALLMAGTAAGRLEDVTEQAGEALEVPRLGRALAVGDLDNDGRGDVLIVAQDRPLTFLHNRTERAAFVTLALEGTRSNRDGVGARVTVSSEGRRRVAQRVGGGSFQASSDPRLHFGLGSASQVDTVEVRWPSGQVDRFTALATNRGYVLREGATQAAPLAGFTP